MNEHGNYDLQRHGQIMLISIEGAWNVPAFEHYECDLRSLAEEMFSAGPWGLIMDARRWELSTPDVLPMVSRLSAWLDQRRLKGSALITKGDFLSESVARETIFGRDRQAPVRLVQSAQDATEFLASCGLKIPESLIQSIRAIEAAAERAA